MFGEWHLNCLCTVYSSSGTNTYGYYNPFFWSVDTESIILNDDGTALDINNHGQIVGFSWHKNGRYAALWDGRQRFDLNVLSGVGTNNFRLVSAEAINKGGHIAGISEAKSRWGKRPGSFLLTPNP